MPTRLFTLFIALGLAPAFSAGCATAANGEEQTRDPVEALDASAEMAQLRRENERLTRRIRQLEERARVMGGEPQPVAAAPTKRHRSASGAPYDLPVVRVQPEGSGPVRPTDSVSIGEVPNSGMQFEPEPEAEAAWQSPASPSGDAPAAYRAPEPEPQPVASDSGVQSYRLVGSRLVKATQAPPKQKQSTRKSSKRSKKHKDAVLEEYEAAMAIYKAGRFREAELAFDGIVQRFASHDYADNALYWKGESAYDQEHYADALAAFTSVVERYGGGNKAPDALLKIGLCYGKLGDAANARDVLTQLIAAYPRARATKVAKSRLEQFSPDAAAGN